jgi:uncharacterized protein
MTMNQFETAHVPSFRRLASVLMLVIAAQLPGCGSSPVVRLHTLLPFDVPAPPNQTAAAGNTAALVVSLSAVNVPAQVDQPQWLVRLPDDTLALLEQDRWAGPLRDELRSALMEVLAARWGAVDARTAGQSPGVPVWQVTVDVSRFESAPGREARLDTRWSATTGQPGTPSAACGSSLREPVADGMPALAQGHRRAVARLADDIGRQLQAMQRGESARCSGAATNTVN